MYRNYTVTLLSTFTFTITYGLTSLPDWSGNRRIYTDQFAIPVFQMLQFCNSDCKIGILVFGIWQS